MTSPSTPKLVPGNPNLRYWYEDTYDGYPLMVEKGPFVEQHLEKLYQTMQYALRDYRTVFAFRIDLSLPLNEKLPADSMSNEVISRFTASLQEQIRWDRTRARNLNGFAHRCRMRSFWVRETGSRARRPHYHLIVFLNQDAYRSIGGIESENINMFKRILLAWASALRVPVDTVSGTVNIPEKGMFHLSSTDYPEIDNFFYRCSYLCKAATKHFGDGHHSCGGSRR